MNSKPTAKLVLNPKSKKDKRSIVLRITYKRQYRTCVLPLDYLLTTDEFNAAVSIKDKVGRGKTNTKLAKQALASANSYLAKANDIIKILEGNFSFEKFRKQFYGEEDEKNKATLSSNIKDLYELYKKEHPQLASSTKESYENALKWLYLYRPNPDIRDVTGEFLKGLADYINKRFRKKLEDEEKEVKDISNATLGFYFRGLRAIYNYAESKLGLSHSDNPFGKNRYRIVNNTNIKKALSIEELQILFRCEPNNDNKKYARDFFEISFGLSGINLADLLALKNKNIDKNGKLTYIRQKTKEHTANQIVTSCQINEKIMNIIREYGHIDISKPESYVFPYISDDMTEIQRLYKRRGINKKINTHLEELCEDLGIGRITYYFARHSFATYMRDEGTSVAIISELLGHANVATTQNYLNSLSDKNLKDVDDKVNKLL